MVSGLVLSPKTSTIFPSGFFHSHLSTLTTTISLFFALLINLSGMKISVLIAGLKGLTNPQFNFFGFWNSHIKSLSALLTTLIILASNFPLKILILASTMSWSRASALFHQKTKICSSYQGISKNQ